MNNCQHPPINYLAHSTQEPKIEETKKDPNSDFQCYHCGKIIQTLDKVKEHIQEIHKCPPRRYGDPRQGLLNIGTVDVNSVVEF